jgi:hypothetical protein
VPVDTSDGEPSPPVTGPAVIANDLTVSQKGAGEGSLHFKLELNTLGFFSSIAPDKNLKFRSLKHGNCTSETVC